MLEKYELCTSFKYEIYVNQEKEQKINESEISIWGIFHTNHTETYSLLWDVPSTFWRDFLIMFSLPPKPWPVENMIKKSLKSVLAVHDERK